MLYVWYTHVQCLHSPMCAEHILQSFLAVYSHQSVCLLSHPPPPPSADSLQTVVRSHTHTPVYSINPEILKNMNCQPFCHFNIDTTSYDLASYFYYNRKLLKNSPRLWCNIYNIMNVRTQWVGFKFINIENNIRSIVINSYNL